MTVPSFVLNAAIETVRAAATDIDTPLAAGVSVDADELVADAAILAARLDAAIAEVEDDRLQALAMSGLVLPAVPTSTANRRLQARNQAALVDLVRGLAAVRLAERTGGRAFGDRLAAIDARDAVVEALDRLDAGADAPTLAALRSLRTAVAERVAEAARALPAVATATPAAVRPSLALAWDIYGDVGRAGEIAGRNRLPRPGFVPARPIEVLST